MQTHTKKNRTKSIFTFSLRNSKNSMEKALLHSSVKFCAVVQELSFLALILPGYCKYYAMFLPLILKILHNYPCLRGMNKNHYPGDCLRFNHWAKMRCCQATCVFWQKIHIVLSPCWKFLDCFTAVILSRGKMNYMFYNIIFFCLGEMLFYSITARKKKKKFLNGFLSDILMWPKQMIVILHNAFWMQCFWE